VWGSLGVLVPELNYVTLGGAVRAAANFATLEASVHGAASEEEK